jgi:hypothetical protein
LPICGKPRALGRKHLAQFQFVKLTG